MDTDQPNNSTQTGQDRPQAGTPLRKRPAFIATMAVLIVLGIVYGIHFLYQSFTHESTDDAAIEGHIIPISPKVAGHILKVHVADNQEVSGGQLLVEIDPRDYQNALEQTRAALQAAQTRKKEAAIQVELTRVTSGADVKQAVSGVDLGQFGVSVARALQATAEKQADQVRASLLAAQADYESSKADVAENKAMADRANADLKRFQSLIDSGVASQQRSDAALAAAREAAAALSAKRKKAEASAAQIKNAQAAALAALEYLRMVKSQLQEAEARAGQAAGHLEEVDVTKQKVAASQSQLETAQAEVSRLEASLKQAELNLSYTKVLAPEAGRVTRKMAEEGAYVQTGQALMAIVPPEVWVVANFKETQLTRMRPGQRAVIRVDAYPGKDFKGHVDSIQAGTGARFSLFPPENATGNYIKVVQRVPVKIVFDEPPDRAHLLAPGMSVVPKVRIR